MLRYFLVTILTVILFLRSFFPVDISTNYSDNLLENATEIPEPDTSPTYDKIVFIVIDSLRHDFIQPHLMPNTWLRSRFGRGCVSKLKAESPTVTLPRIKAMTTGRVPQFLDVVRNLASSEVLEDSWLHSAKKIGKRIVFYGDNTWLKLFPDFFHRYEGTHSFFVNDFKEVDDNVTNNVIKELEKTDWDVMVLHYLGLDHIGHVLGAFNKEILWKLTEMDHVISVIYQKLIKDKHNVLIFVTGDHGMRDIGGHGGSSHPETTVPFVLIGANCSDTFFSQTDLPVNLASLLGLEIPSTSIGRIQKDFLRHLPFEKYLFAMRQNTKLLLRKKNLCYDEFDTGGYLHLEYLKKGDGFLGKSAAEYYRNCSERIVEELGRLSGKKQDDYNMVVCFLVFFNVLLVYFGILFGKSKKISNSSFLILFSIASFQILMNIPIISLLSIVLLVYNFVKGCIKIYKHFRIKINDFVTFLYLVLLVQPFTFFSSSFLEEEHQYWYFFLNTTILVIIVQFFKSKLNNLDTFQFLFVLISFRFLKRLNSVGDKWLNYPDISDWLLKTENYLFYQLFFVFGLSTLFCYDYFKISQNTKHLLHSAVILTLIFIFKTYGYQQVILGRLIWFLIVLKGRSLLIFAGVLLLKPYNVLLVPFCLFASSIFCKNFESNEIMTILHVLLSNCLYFAQGHTNSLASVDVSVGYIGLNDYHPILVISQTLLHIYLFPLLCHKLVLEKVDKNKFWLILISQRTLVLTLTCLVNFIHKEHISIWTVFAPKLLIESVHTVFLFLEYSFYILFSSCKKRIVNYRKKYI